MFTRTVMLLGLACAVSLTAENVWAAGQEQSQEKQQTQRQEQERVYGSDLMTPEERAEHREKMRSLKTPEEREAFRLEHHKKMQERAKERGVTIPEVPPPHGGGMGPRGGRGR